AFGEAINRGIEQADNLVYLLSPESINSTYCQQELDLALSLNKRIIPVLVRTTEPNLIPEVLRDLQYIDLTDNVREEDYLLDESQLLKILHEDEAYYNEHKMLLTRALKWKRQNENPTILLRGYNLRSAETWLKVAQKRKQHPPTQLQEEFITESLRQPPLESLDVFISYSRADSDLGRKLNDNLQMQGKTTWFDQESIASGTDFQQEINRGIKACDNFLFILSSRSVNSPYCADEVEYAASLNKRFVTVLHRQVNPADLHPELAKVQWIDFNQKDFNANFNELVRTLDIDREHVHSHTKWLQRAIEWEQEGKSEDLLLQGSEFVVAQNWIETALAKNKQPVPTALQQIFAQESHQAIIAEEETEKTRQAELLCLQEEKTKEAEARLAEQKKNARLQKRLLGVMIVLCCVACGISGFAFYQKQKAEEQKRAAEENLAAQVDALSRYSKTLVKSEQNFDALIEGIRAGKQLISKSHDESQQNKATSQQVEKVLREALYDSREIQRLGGQGTSVVKFSPDKKTIATIEKDGQVKLWNFNNKDNQAKTLSDEQEIAEIFFSPGNSRMIATLSKDKTVKLWNKDGKELAFIDKTENVSEVVLSPDGKFIATFTDKEQGGIGKLWKLDKKKLKHLIPNEKVNFISFNYDGKIASYNREEKTIKFWQLNSSKLTEETSLLSNEKFDDLSLDLRAKIITTSNQDEKTVKFWSLDGKELKFPISAEQLGQYSLKSKISSEGKMLATFEENQDKEVKLWYSNGKESKTLSHNAEIAGIWFSPNNQIIATASDDTIVNIWNQEGEKIATLAGHSKPVYNVTFSQDGKVIATASYDKTVKLWNDKGNKLKNLYPNIAVDEVHFNSDNKIVATLDENKIVKLWNIDNKDRQFLNHEAPVDSVSFSTDGKLLVTSSSSKNNPSAKLWNLEGKQSKRLFPRKKLDNVKFSPYGKLVVTSSGFGNNKIKQLWRLEDNKLQPLLPKKKFNKVEFSTNGKLLVTSSGSGDSPTKQLWSLEDNKLQSRLPKEKFDKVEFCSNGKMVALFSNNEDKTTIKLWKPDKDTNPVRFITLASKQSPNVEFTPNCKLMAVSVNIEDKQTAKLWSLESTQPKFLLPQEKFNNVEFSPDSQLMTILSNNDNKATIKLWSLEGKQPKFLHSTQNFEQVEFSSDGKLIAIFSYDEKETGIELLKHENLNIIPFATYNFDNEYFSEVEFSPNSKSMVISSSSQDDLWEEHKLWTVDSSDAQKLQLQPIDKQFYEVVFSSDGNLIATFDGSNTVRLWNRNNEQLASLDFKNSIKNLSFSPDNKKLAITNYSNTVVLWDLEQRTEWKELQDKGLKELVEEGCDKVKNYLKRKNEKDPDRKLCD
ncbi:MAG: TIR domain-containing protein, partial [Symploca sp. SIO2G7]|nr:TIR domain-containing protein [Symploca sp. SIO2G7]